MRAKRQPVQLSPVQRERCAIARAETLRQIAFAARNESASHYLLLQADAWIRKAAEIRQTAARESQGSTARAAMAGGRRAPEAFS